MYNKERKIMHKILVGRGMHPNVAHHVVINSGSGILDWIKKHKDALLKFGKAGWDLYK
jgi:hypothetical protein